MKIRALIIISLIFIPILGLAAQPNVDSAYNWLISRPNTDVFGASLNALAVSKADQTRAKIYIDYIKNNKHASQACWPQSSCTVKDTVAALLVETKLGLNIQGTTANDIISWLVLKQSIASLPGTWNLQIITPDTGQCTLRFQKQGEVLSNDFVLDVNKGKITY